MSLPHWYHGEMSPDHLKDTADEEEDLLDLYLERHDRDDSPKLECEVSLAYELHEALHAQMLKDIRAVEADITRISSRQRAALLKKIDGWKPDVCKELETNSDTSCSIQDEHPKAKIHLSQKVESSCDSGGDDASFHTARGSDAGEVMKSRPLLLEETMTEAVIKQEKNNQDLVNMIKMLQDLVTQHPVNRKSSEELSVIFEKRDSLIARYGDDLH